jgi:outer membrane lipoprotein-sorting protein
MGAPIGRSAIHAIAVVAATCILLVRAGAVAPTDDKFDEMYSRGQKANAAMKTLTARFIETTTSSLLTKPIVARGRLTVERPSRVILRYTEPDARVTLIDGNKMTIVWPSRSIRQTADITTAQGRIQKYFVNGTAADLRGQFDIEDQGLAGDRPTAYHVSMVPKRKQIRAVLARLDLWVDRTSLLLDTMKMTFANGDTKTMVFEDVVPNAPVEPGTFIVER